MWSILHPLITLSCLAICTLGFDDRSRLGEYVTAIQIFRTPGTSNAVEVAIGTPGKAVNLTLSECDLAVTTTRRCSPVWYSHRYGHRVYHGCREYLSRMCPVVRHVRVLLPTRFTWQLNGLYLHCVIPSQV